MGDVSRYLDAVDTMITGAESRGLIHLSAQDDRLDGRSVTVKDRPLINFESCSYLGLEMDPRLQEAVIDAVTRYGCQFSASRSYISAPGYTELESLLDELTGGHTLVTPNTTLAHLSALPVLIGEDDAVIMDHQVHHTVKLAIPQLRQQGTQVEIIRHGRLDLLEERICQLKDSHRYIWYLADGVYSMEGHLAPIHALSLLAAQYEQLHLYIDDAHGMSWYGQHGRGYALEELSSRSRCVVAVSLNKAFAAAGGALVFSDEAQRNRVRKCGGPAIFTGPIQPPMLGAAIASAKIHLSPEITELQGDVLERIRYANHLARDLDLPLANSSEVPIRFMALGLPVVTYAMCQHLLDNGFLTSVATFPAVSAQRTGIRFTITRHQELADIRRLLEVAAEYLPVALAENGSSRDEVDRLFDHTPQRSCPAVVPGRLSDSEPSRTPGLEIVLQHETSIRAIDQQEWDRCLAGRGSFSWEGLLYLESVFGSLEKEDENYWGFHYYIARDADGEVLLATFFTDALWKDDMLSDAVVSKRVEAQRDANPRFLTSRVFSMGSLLTEGDHLYLNFESRWQPAFTMLLDAVAGESDACQAGSVAFRDLDPDNADLHSMLSDVGFTQFMAPDSMVIDVTWDDWDEYVSGMSQKARRFHRRYVTPRDGLFSIEVLTKAGRTLSGDEWDHLYRLYQNVQERNLALNTFRLPENFLPLMMEHDDWEIFTLTLTSEDSGVGSPPHAFGASYIGPNQYALMMVGLDYRFVSTHGVYRQCLRQTLRRAEANGSSRVLMGIGTELEKRRFGARGLKHAIYLQSKDLYQHDVLSLLGAGSKSS